MVTQTGDRTILFRKTDELSPQDRADYRALFDRVYGKKMSGEQFDRKYLRTPRGYSYHSLMFADDQLVGAYNIIPYRYNCFGAQRLFGLSADLMIEKEHRGGPFNVFKMAMLVHEKLIQDGIAFVFGFPNDNAYQLTKRVLKWTDMGELDFYALPINIRAIRPTWRWAGPLSRLGAYGLAHLPRKMRQTPFDFGVTKVWDDQFRKHRYNHEHQVADLTDGGKCVYRVFTEEDNVRILYIIDVMPLTPTYFAESVRALYAVAAKCADLILYVGRLPFGGLGLVRVPASRRPRRIIMCGKILNPQLVDERVLLIRNWNVNISNFDVR